MPTRTVLMLAAVALATCGCANGGNPFSSSTDLLKMADPVGDAVSGEWKRDGGMIQSEVTDRARLALRAVPHGDYNLQARFSRVIGEGPVSLILPVGDSQVMLVISGRANDGPRSGLELLDGQTSDANITTDAQFDIVNHRLYRLNVTVRTAGDAATIDVDLDDLPFIRWSGNQNDLTLPDEWALGGDSVLGIGASYGVVQFHWVRLRMLPGKMEELRGAGAAAGDAEPSASGGAAPQK